MDVSVFDFELPEKHIALRPAAPRDTARLMVVHGNGQIEHRHVRDLPDYIQSGDALVVNNTRVIPARLHGVRMRNLGPAKIEILLHRRTASNRFAALARPARKLELGDILLFGDLTAEVLARGTGGEVEIEFNLSGSVLDAAVAAQGEMPLPPYIAGKRKADTQDREDYQTIFAEEPGSAAAPTAGLHFTRSLLAVLEKKEAKIETVTLEVGLGTFLPVTANDTTQHRMHPEHAVLKANAADRLNSAKKKGARILAVGTTSLRTLESAAGEDGVLRELDGDTSIFITPGYRFRAVDMLLTNFHLPRSTLFMLVCAFSGVETMRKAYMAAIQLDYRFYSYGDACLLFRPA